MHAERAFQDSRSLPAWVSLALTVTLLALSTVLMAGLVFAQTGSISGAVTYYGGAEPFTYHLNVDAFNYPGGPFVAGINTYVSGGYTIGGLPDGAYEVCAAVDLGDWSMPYVCYDADGDGAPDPVVVSGGGAATGIVFDLGGPWLPLGGPIAEGGQPNALSVHPTISGTVYAAVADLDAYDSGPSVIYKTTDGANSWTPVYTAEHQVYALAATGTHVYAGAFNPGGEGASIYTSNDSGVTWSPVLSYTDRGVWLDLAVHPTDPDVAIIGGWAYHGVGDDRVQSGFVYKTEDGGVTWTSSLTATFPDSEGTVNAVLIHPVTPTLMLAAGHGEGSSDGVLYRSEDGGATWPVSVPLANAQFISLVAHSSDPRMLYAGTTNDRFARGPSRAFRSLDAGRSWEEVYSDAGGRLLFEPPHTVYGVTYSGRVSRSTSDGDPGTWSQIGHSDGGLSFDIDLGPSAASLYAGTRERGVSKSTDGGFNWEKRNEGIGTAVSPIDIDVDPQNLDKILVAADCGGGWMTGDRGETWLVPSGLPGCVGAFSINPEAPDVVYAGSGGCDVVFRSGDGGENFGPVYTSDSCDTGGYENILALAIAPSTTDTIYAAGHDNPYDEDFNAVILSSPDDGVSWTEVFTLPPLSDVQALAINPADDGVLYAGGVDCHAGPCEGYVYRTTDGGDTWTQVYTGDRQVRSIVVNYWNPDVLYLADRYYDVYKSIDGGETWTLIRSNEPPFNAPSGHLLAIDPNVPSHVYLGGWGYIAETPDGGQTWLDGDINQGTPLMEPSALAVDNGTVTQTLYAGFGGVWAYSRPAPQPLRVYLPVALRNY